MASAKIPWFPSSWRSRQTLQQPDYADSGQLDRILAEIRRNGSLVTPKECAALRDACAAAASGEAFIVQAGDCAESLDQDAVAAAETTTELIATLSDAVGGEAVSIARIAGQFAKPRSEPFEARDGMSLPSYRGDAINGLPFDLEARRHDPARLLAAYRHSAATLGHLHRLDRRPYTSHEALVLPYEESLLSQDEDGRWWSGSAHMLWIGERTRQVNGGHIQFASGIENVVGVKCGPSLGTDELVHLADKLDPARVAGKLLLIGRFGAKIIEDCLPPLLRASRREGLAATWMIDPMHGNTRHYEGRKQRRITDMIEEVRAFFAICRSEGVDGVGIHLEVTAGAGSECIGPDGRDPMADFPCDPRLNAEQARYLVGLAASLRRVPAEA